MGCTRWSDDNYHERARCRARTGRDAFEYDHDIRCGAAARRVHQKMDPRGVTVRGKVTEAGSDKPARLYWFEAARAADQRPRSAVGPHHATGLEPGTGSRLPPEPNVVCCIPRPRLQTPRPHHRTGVRAAQDLPETDHDAPPGLAMCENEWLLACAAHNLRKLHRHRAENCLSKARPRQSLLKIVRRPRTPPVTALHLANHARPQAGRACDRRLPRPICQGHQGRLAAVSIIFEFC